MSSSSIWTEINSCETQINTLCSEINALECKVEEQESAVQQFKRLSSDFTDEITDKNGKIDSVNSYDPEVVLSVRFQSATATEYVEKQTTVFEYIAVMEQAMQTELNDNYIVLDNKKALLVQLNSTLGNLNSCYQTALAQEEQERQAAAALLQSNQKK